MTTMVVTGIKEMDRTKIVGLVLGGFALGCVVLAYGVGVSRFGEGCEEVEASSVRILPEAILPSEQMEVLRNWQGHPRLPIAVDAVVRDGVLALEALEVGRVDRECFERLLAMDRCSLEVRRAIFGQVGEGGGDIEDGQVWQTRVEVLSCVLEQVELSLQHMAMRGGKHSKLRMLQWWMFYRVVEPQVGMEVFRAIPQKIRKTDSVMLDVFLQELTQVERRRVEQDLSDMGEGMATKGVD